MIGKMTVAFGNLDFTIGLLVNHVAEQMGEERIPVFTARKAEALKEWGRAHRDVLGDKLVEDIVRIAGDTKALYRRRPDGAHGMWIQEDDPDKAWVLALREGQTRGVRSSMDAATIGQLADEARALDLRVGQLTVQFLKAFPPEKVNRIRR